MAVVGVVIMLGTLFGLIVLVFGLVLRFDPEARHSAGSPDGPAARTAARAEVPTRASDSAVDAS